MLKRTLKAIALITILVVSCSYIMNGLQYKTYDTDIINGFYSQPKDTLDAVYIGPSSVYRFWMGPEAFHNHGIAIYGLSTANQPISAIKYLMIEADKTQKQSLYIIDLRSFIEKAYSEGEMRKVTDNMKFSANRTNAINSMLKGVDPKQNTSNKWEYYFSFLKYHSRWAEVGTDISSAIIPVISYMGFGLSKTNAISVKSVNKPYKTDKMVKLTPQKEEYLVELLKYCKENDKNVLFTITPFSATKSQAEQLNEVKSIIKQYDYPVFDGNTMYNVMGINFKTDFYNVHHVNTNGAIKFTDYFAEYLVKNYKLPDHRGDKAYKSWENSYDALNKKIAVFKAAK